MKSGGLRRSRHGCRNCKLRRVKCDEARPHCVRCRTYGVRCNYQHNVPDLQPLGEGTTQRTPGRVSGGLSLQSSISSTLWYADRHMLDSQDQELFTRFRYRTLYSLGGPAMVEAPFLMHGTLAVAAAHERYLSEAPQRTLREIYHFSQCTTLLNSWLHHRIEEKDKDPLWATAGALAILSFSSITSRSPAKTWPLGPPDSSDLEWLRLGAGKMGLWRFVNPVRPESAFRKIYDAPTRQHERLPKEGDAGVSSKFARLCGISERSTPDNNPYFTVVHHISRLMEVPKGEASEDEIMMVVGHMHGKFAEYLKRKDPVALILLGLWYSRASETKWWIEVRARYELPAIWTYLKRYHGDNGAIQVLRPFSGLGGLE
ncbi:hypothetical protein BJX65DRAFT_321452 [Aspergillus insuetus]